MKKILITSALIFLVSIWILSGCGPKPGVYGKAITETKTTAVSEISASPANFSGKDVRLEGKIVQECPAGGWFMLKDNTGVIFVDLHPTQIVIPQAVGRGVSAQGKVKKEGNQVSVVGEGVELK
ncbi:MAG: hypothetical protein NTZ92_06590 [Candidatus Omnitrophica bacterium]|nr:hypothetical protein [Candidatus Omnitrophota bacterium]